MLKRDRSLIIDYVADKMLRRQLWYKIVWQECFVSKIDTFINIQVYENQINYL